MTSASSQFIDARGALPLPAIVRTRNGAVFDPSSALWAFRDDCVNISINFKLVPDSCTPLVDGLKRVLIWYLENRNAGTTRTNFDGFVVLARFLASTRDEQIRCITHIDILAFKTSSQVNYYALSIVRAFLVQWSRLGAPGIGPNIADFLLRLPLKQRPVGVAVATLDSAKGPFTDLEFESIQTALNAAYARGEIDAGRLLICYLFMSLGARPAQLASLKCRDLIVPKGSTDEYFLHVPRAKQRGQLGRTEFKIRRLAAHIGSPLASYISDVMNEFSGRMCDTANAPMFPQRRTPAHSYAHGFEFHQTSQVLAWKIGRLFEKLCISTDRLEGQPIPVNSLRFRRTFATRAAEEGWPLVVLAELMDHSNTRSVEIYSGLTTRIRAAFSRKIALDMAPLAMAFSGKLIREENEARRPGPASRIIDLRVDQGGAPMGSCGSNVHCGFARPLACYGGCHEFEPWLDGPHEEALRFMLEKRERLVTETDNRIAAINDRAILGCAQIILRCAQIKAGESK